MIEIYVFCNRGVLPTATGWNAALKPFGFRINPKTSFLSQDGYLPVKWGKNETGFEYSLEPYDEASFGDLENRIRGYDSAVTFRFSDEDEAFAASISGAMLASLTSGVFFDPQENLVLDHSRAAGWAKELFEKHSREQKQIAETQRRTVKDWRTACLPIAQKIHPDYEINKVFKGCLRVV